MTQHLHSVTAASRPAHSLQTSSAIVPPRATAPPMSHHHFKLVPSHGLNPSTYVPHGPGRHLPPDHTTPLSLPCCCHLSLLGILFLSHFGVRLFHTFPYVSRPPLPPPLLHHFKCQVGTQGSPCARVPGFVRQDVCLVGGCGSVEPADVAARPRGGGSLRAHNHSPCPDAAGVCVDSASTCVLPLHSISCLTYLSYVSQCSASACLSTASGR